MFSYKSSLTINLNHSIRISDDHVIEKHSHGIEGENWTTPPLDTHKHALRQKLNRVGEKPYLK